MRMNLNGATNPISDNCRDSLDATTQRQYTAGTPLQSSSQLQRDRRAVLPQNGGVSRSTERVETSPGIVEGYQIRTIEQQPGTMVQSSVTHTRDASVKGGPQKQAEGTLENEHTYSRPEKEFLKYSMPLQHALTNSQNLLQHVSALSTPPIEQTNEKKKTNEEIEELIYPVNDYLAPLQREEH